MRQADSDPLPFIQIDRAAEPTAALLAGVLKESHQHAIGSLYEFWKLCADPRDLEAIVAATPHGQEPEVILSADEVSLRFELASGHRVEPLILARLGLLEVRAASTFRVRGMSRSLAPIERRIAARRIASAGGKASAEARKRATGTAQPVGGNGSGCSVSSSVDSAPEPNRPPKRDRTGHRTATEPATEPATEHRGQRSEVIEKDKDLSGRPDLVLLEVEPDSPIKPEDRLTDDEYAVFEHWRVVMNHPKAVATPKRKRVIADALKHYPVAALQDAIDGCARSAWHMGENDRHTRFDSLELILRDAKNIESFQERARVA